MRWPQTWLIPAGSGLAVAMAMLLGIQHVEAQPGRQLTFRVETTREGWQESPLELAAGEDVTLSYTGAG